jgi:hypothetical protein
LVLSVEVKEEDAGNAPGGAKQNQMSGRADRTTGLSDKYPRRAERSHPRECARDLAARSAQRNAEPGQ